MDRKEHLKVDGFLYNQEYNEVHAWLDSSYPKYAGKNPYMHWLEHHHIQAITEKYGHFTLEYNVAYMHILMDYLSHFQIAFVPINKEDAEKMLKALEVIR